MDITVHLTDNVPTIINTDDIIAYQSHYIGLSNGVEYDVVETLKQIELAIKETRFF